MDVDHQRHRKQRRRQVDDRNRYEHGDQQAANVDRRGVALAQRFRFTRRVKAHGGKFEINAAEEPCGGEKVDHRTQAYEQQKHDRAEIDHDGKECRFAALDHRKPQWQRLATRIGGVVLVLDDVGDLIGKEACHKRSHRRHQHDTADHDAEARRDREHPGERLDRQIGMRPERGLPPAAAGADQPDDRPVERNRHRNNERQGEPDRFPQHRPQRRRKYLRQRIDRGLEHQGLLLSPV